MSRHLSGITVAVYISLIVLGANAKEGVEMPDTFHTELKELNVTGIKNTSSTDSSSPSQNIKAEQILNQGITDIADAMKRFAGVNLRDYGGSGGLKTISIRGLGAQHTGVVYDGAAVSDMQTGQIDLSRYSLDNVSSLTVNIGDDNDIFAFARSNSSAASLVIKSLLSPELSDAKPHLTARMRFASFRTLNPYIKFSKSNGKNLAFALSGDYIFSKNNYPFSVFNGEEISYEKRENSRIRTGHFEGTLIWKPSISHTLRAKGYFYDNNRLLPGPVIYYASPSNEHLKEKNTFGQIDYNGKLSSKISLKAIGKFNWSSSRYTDINGKYPGGKLDDHYIQNEEYLAASLAYFPIDGLRFSYAADYFHNYLKDFGNKNSCPTRDTYLQALSGQYSNHRLRVTARSLWSMISDKSELDNNKFTNKVSPSVALSFRVLNHTDWNLRVSYKNIFRMPTFNELYFDHYGTVNLEPEITNQINLGTTYAAPSFGNLNCLEVTIDGFVNNIKNKIVAIPFNMFLWTMTNMGKVKSTGLDITLNSEIILVPKHKFLINGSYSYLRSVSRTSRDSYEWNKQLPYTPLNSGSWSLSWINPWVNIIVHGDGCSSRYSTSANIKETRMSGYMTFGFTLYREFKYRQSTWEIRGDIVNALNKQYEIVRRYPMPGRAFSIGIGLKVN